MKIQTLFALEWIKLRNLRTLIFLILFIIIATALSFMVFAMVNLPARDGKSLFTLAEMNPFGKLLGTFTGNLAVISSLFFIMQTSGEYKHGLIRKNVMDGMSRNDVFNGRMLFLFGSYTCWALLLLVVFVICGTFRLVGSFSEILVSIQFTQLIKFLIFLFFFGVFSQLLVTLTRSSTLSIIILLGILFLEPIGILVLRYYKFTEVIPYLPFELAGSVRTEDTVSNSKVFVFLCYFLSFLGLSQYVNFKRDL